MKLFNRSTYKQFSITWIGWLSLGITVSILGVASSSLGYYVAQQNQPHLAWDYRSIQNQTGIEAQILPEIPAVIVYSDPYYNQCIAKNFTNKSIDLTQLRNDDIDKYYDYIEKNCLSLPPDALLSVNVVQLDSTGSMIGLEIQNCTTTRNNSQAGCYGDWHLGYVNPYLLACRSTTYVCLVNNADFYKISPEKIRMAQAISSSLEFLPKAMGW